MNNRNIFFEMTTIFLLATPGLMIFLILFAIGNIKLHVITELVVSVFVLFVPISAYIYSRNIVKKNDEGEKNG